MRAKQLGRAAGRSWAIKLTEGDEVVSSLTEFARQHRVRAASFTAIGVFSSVIWGFFDREAGAYEKTALQEDVEVLALVGNVSTMDGAPVLHAHVTVAGRDGRARGGHLLEAHVWPTLEVMVTELPEMLERAVEAETGLALLAL